MFCAQTPPHPKKPATAETYLFFFSIILYFLLGSVSWDTLSANVGDKIIASIFPRIDFLHSSNIVVRLALDRPLHCKLCISVGGKKIYLYLYIYYLIYTAYYQGLALAIETERNDKLQSKHSTVDDS